MDTDLGWIYHISFNIPAASRLTVAKQGATKQGLKKIQATAVGKALANTVIALAIAPL